MNKTIKDKRIKDFILIGLGIILLVTPLIYLGEIRGYKGTKDFFGQSSIFVLFIIWLNQNEKINFRLNVLNKLIFLFISLIVISFIFTNNYYLSFLGLKKWLSYILIYLLTITNINKIKNVRRMFYILVITSFLAALFGIINFYGFHFDSVIETLRGRGKVISTFGNPNYLSSFIGPILPINFYLLLTEKNKKIRFSLFITFSVIYTAVIFTRTRGVLLGLVFVSLFITCNFIKHVDRKFLLKKKRIIIITCILIICLTSIFSGDIPFSDENIGSLASRFERNNLLGDSNYRRIMLWLISCDMIKTSPLIGKGIGTYTYMYPQYQRDFLAIKKNQGYKFLADEVTDAHNEYLQIAAESGIFTLITFITMLIYIAYTFFKRISYRSLEKNLLLIMLGSSLLVIAIHSLVSFPLRLMQTGVLYWFLMGIANNLLNMNGSHLYISDKFNKKYLNVTKIIVTGCLIVLIILTTSIFIGDRKLAAGWQQERDGGNFQKAQKYYRQALKYNPYDGRIHERLGAIYRRLGWYQKAEEEFRKASKTIISEKLYNEIGMNFGKQGLYNKSIQALKQGIGFYPYQVIPYLNLGLVNKLLSKDLFMQGNTEVAINKLQKSFLYLEQAKTLSKDPKEKKIINKYLIDVATLLLKYIYKYPQKLSNINVHFFAPKPQLPVVDVLTQKAKDNYTEVQLFIYNGNDYKKPLNRQKIFNQNIRLFEEDIEYKEYLIGNAKIVELKIEGIKDFKIYENKI